MKQIHILVCALILTALFVTACGLVSSPGMSDEEFAVEASYACDELQEELEFVETLEQESEAFAEAAEMIKEFNLDPETAPQAVVLKDSLVALVDACLVFDDALDQAAAQNGWDGYTWMLTEGYSVFGYSSDAGIFGITTLDVDEAVVKDYVDNWNAVSEAAEALGLEGCQLDSDS